MSIKLKVCLAEMPIEIESQSEFMQDFCRDYLTEKSPLFSVKTNKESVETELKSATEPTTPEYAEALCLYREIAERIPLYNSVVFHGAAIEFGGKAYLFTAPSGTGKTTHIALWRKFLGESVDIINGDKPIIRLTDKGFYVYGTPYAGKEGWNRNAFAPLGGICFLSQGLDNKVEKLQNGLFFRLFEQIYKPKEKTAMEKTVDIVKNLCSVPCFSVACDISENAVKSTFEALTDSKYGVEKMKIKDEYIKVEVGDEISIVPTGEASREKNGVFMLNETGAAIFDCIAEGKSIDETVEILMKEYDAEPSEIEEYVKGFVEELRAAGMIEDE